MRQLKSFADLALPPAPILEAVSSAQSTIVIPTAMSTTTDLPESSVATASAEASSPIIQPIATPTATPMISVAMTQQRIKALRSRLNWRTFGVLASLYVMLFVINYNSSPIPTTPPSYAATHFDGNGVIGGTFLRVSYPFREMQQFSMTSMFGYRVYYYRMDHDLFRYDQSDHTWYQLKFNK